MLNSRSVEAEAERNERVKVWKMVKEICFPKPKMTSSNVLFCPQPKNNQFTVIEEERNHKMFTFKKLESENFNIFPLTTTQNN